jgi:hypothetical protein
MKAGENFIMTKFIMFNSPSNIARMIESQMIRWAGHEACVGRMRNAYRILFGKPKDKNPLRRPRRRWENNFKLDLEDIRYIMWIDWINLAQDSV